MLHFCNTRSEVLHLFDKMGCTALRGLVKMTSTSCTRGVRELSHRKVRGKSSSPGSMHRVWTLT